MYPMRFLDVTLDTYQNTSGYMYLGLFITIHQDTPRYKITIHVSWTRHDDTSRYKHTIRIHKGYIRDTCGIHAGYMYLQRFEDTCRIHTWYMQDNQGYMRDICICSGSRIHKGYMRDTSMKIHIGIRVSQMYPERYVSEMQDTCGIHARYMYLQG